MNHRLEKLEKLVRLEELKIQASNSAIRCRLDAVNTNIKDWYNKRAETYLAIANRLDKRITTLIKEL